MLNLAHNIYDYTFIETEFAQHYLFIKRKKNTKFGAITNKEVLICNS